MKFSPSSLIQIQNFKRFYKAWENLIIICAFYSVLFTPLEFGFTRGLSMNLSILDILVQLAFFLDAILQFCVAFQDNNSRRCLIFQFLLNILACMPWNIIYKVSGRKEAIRYLMWIRLIRFHMVIIFFNRLEKDVRNNYLYTRTLEYLLLEFYIMYNIICISYNFSPETHPEREKGHTSLMDIWKQCIWLKGWSMLWLSIVIVVPPFGVISIVIMLVWIDRRLSYKRRVEMFPLFRGCSAEFKHKIADRMHEENFGTGIMIMSRGDFVDPLYFICYGVLEEIWVGEDGSEAKVSLLMEGDSFGATSVLCNIPQHCYIRASQSHNLLYIDRQSFSRILEIYCADGCRVLNNVINDGSIANNAAYCGDLKLLRSLIRAGADPRKNYCNGRSALHEAASGGHDKIVEFLIQEGLDINAKDGLGNTPLFDALNGGHDGVASLLHSKGALLEIGDPGNFMCNTILGGDSYLLKRLLSYGIDPNSKDSMGRTLLHVAASKGLYVMSKVLLEAGADVLAKDRIGCTPLDEGRNCTNVNTIRLLEEAANVTHTSCNCQETKDKAHRKRPSVFAHHPLQGGRSTGIVVSVPDTVQALSEVAAEHLEVELGNGWSILSHQ